jgi:hypothetical protein
MLNFLKSDNTWFPEQEEDFFVIRANKDFTINANDFEEYPVGIRFDFPEEYKVIIEIHESYKNILNISNNILMKSNYRSLKQTTVSIINKSRTDVFIKNTEKLLKCYLINSKIERSECIYNDQKNKNELIAFNIDMGSQEINQEIYFTASTTAPKHDQHTTAEHTEINAPIVDNIIEPVCSIITEESAVAIVEHVHPIMVDESVVVIVDTPISIVDNVVKPDHPIMAGETIRPVPDITTPVVTPEEEKPKRRYIKKKTV